MADTLRPADRVCREDGRIGVLDGVFAEAVAWVSWDDDRPGYESIENLSKSLSGNIKQDYKVFGA